MTVTDFEEYSLRLSAMFGCNMCSQITVGNVTLPKAVLSTVKIFAVCSFLYDPFHASPVGSLILTLRVLYGVT